MISNTLIKKFSEVIFIFWHMSTQLALNLLWSQGLPLTTYLSCIYCLNAGITDISHDGYLR